MPESEYELLLPRLALHLKLLTSEQVAEAMRRWRAAGAPELGEFLEGQGSLSSEQVAHLRLAREEYLRRRGESPPASGERSTAEPALAAPEPPGPALESEAESPMVAALARELAAPASRPEPEQPSAPPAPRRPREGSSGSLRTNVSFSAFGGGEGAGEARSGSAPSSVALRPAEWAKGEAPAASPPRERGPQGFVYRPGESKLDDLLTRTLAAGASDLHLHAGVKLKLRWNGALVDVSEHPLSPEETERLVMEILDPQQKARLAEDQQVDLAHAIAGVGRFRGNVYLELRGLDATFRAIPPQAPTLEELGLPASLTSLTQLHQGLVLFTGPAGCGKSSTMASLVRQLTEQRGDHIITLEDPIEFVFTSKSGLVNQREVGSHTASFARALRAALREDPDVIVVGELRDLETISLALTAAETGHLVLATLHTASALRTIHRLLGVFPAAQQAQIRTMLSESLRAIVSQRLLPRADGTGRVVAVEILISNKAVSNLIRENKVFQIHSLMQTGATRGMMLLDASLAELVKSGAVTREQAARQAEDPKKLG